MTQENLIDAFVGGIRSVSLALNEARAIPEFSAAANPNPMAGVTDCLVVGIGGQLAAGTVDALQVGNGYVQAAKKEWFNWRGKPEDATQVQLPDVHCLSDLCMVASKDGIGGLVKLVTGLPQAIYDSFANASNPREVGQALCTGATAVAGGTAVLRAGVHVAAKTARIGSTAALDSDAALAARAAAKARHNPGHTRSGCPSCTKTPRTELPYSPAGQYRLGKFLGEGAFKKVYEVQGDPTKALAILRKELPPEYQAQAVRALQDEVATLNQLSATPGLPVVKNYGLVTTTTGELAILMENFVDGITVKPKYFQGVLLRQDIAWSRLNAGSIPDLEAISGYLRSNRIGDFQLMINDVGRVVIHDPKQLWLGKPSTPPDQALILDMLKVARGR